MATEEPDCGYDESTKPGYVRIRMRIPGIKPRAAGMFSKAKQPERGNAEIEGPLYGNENKSIKVVITDKGGLDGSNYKYEVHQLPYPIIPEKTELKIEKDQVILLLKKKDKDKSWETYFRSGSLETA